MAIKLLYPSLQGPVPVVTAASTLGYWYTSWSEPVRQRIDPKLSIALDASGLFMTPVTFGEVISADKWFNWLSEPVRQKPGLMTALQRDYTMDPASLTRPVIIARGYIIV